MRSWARLGSNQQPLACETSALPFELLARAPGQGVEPRSPRSERGVLPVRRSRNDSAEGEASPSSSRKRKLDAAGAHLSATVVVIRCHARRFAERCFPCLSPTLRPWIAVRPLRSLRRSSSYVEELWSPKLSCHSEKAHAKANANCTRVIPARTEVFLSQAGPRFELELPHSEHHLHSGSECRTGKREWSGGATKKGDPFGSPSTGLVWR